MKFCSLPFVLRLGFGIVLILTIATGAFAVTEISFTPPNGASGQTVELPVMLATDDNPVALQLDLAYDPTELEIEQAEAGDALEDHGVGYLELGNGLVRSLAVSPTNEELKVGRVIVFRVRLLKDVAPGASSVSLGQVVVSDANGVRVGAALDGVARITAPTAGAQFDSGANVLIRAVSLSNDDGLTRVEFKVNGQTIATETAAPFETTWIAGAGGNYVITVQATAASGKSALSSPVSIQVNGAGGGVTLEDWLAANFTQAERNDPNVSGLMIDFDGDLLNNLLELAFGGDPKVRDGERHPDGKSLTIGNENYLTMTYRRPSEAPVGVTYGFQSSNDLSDWNEENNLVEIDRQADGDDLLITLRDAAPFQPDTTRYLRIIVSINQ